MAALDDLIREIQDDDLRGRIKAEFDKLRKRKKFGLVFESAAEYSPLCNAPVKVGSLVAKDGKLDAVYKVTAIVGDDVTCVRDNETVTCRRADLIVVTRLGDSVYPALTKLDDVCRAPDSNLWHVLIEAENFHALQLLRYLYAGKVDCLYIDPPYNAGARDWKYNNDYVDAADKYRHSKWLSMMERRLALAKELLSDSGAIFISIDDNEACNLKLLCDDVFGYKNFVANIAVINNLKGRSDDKYIATAHEYLLIYRGKDFVTNGVPIPEEYLEEYKLEDDGGKYRLQGLRKRGSNSRREDRPNMFYPFFYDENSGVLSVDELPDSVKILPHLSDGRDGCWRWGKDTARERISELIVQVVRRRGEFDIFQKDYLPSDGTRRVKPKSFWAGTEFSAEAGTLTLKNILGQGTFNTAKPLGMIKYILQQATNKNSLVLDFFAGSGTTLHAVNLLNAEDGGRRRCILVTNNEVSEAEAKRMTAAGLTPADAAWQAAGIARHVTWQRTVCSIEGHDINGAPLNGNYLGSDLPMAGGFAANAIFFKLDCLDKDAVALGKCFRELLPLLWLKAGGFGKCPTVEENPLPPFKIFAENKFAVLLDEKRFGDFTTALKHATIETVFIATGRNAALNKMRELLRVPKAYRLYGDYLKNIKLKEAKR